jgi:hypothetical protein
VSTVRLTVAQALLPQARKVYESHKAEQRAFLTPITQEIAK